MKTNRIQITLTNEEKTELKNRSVKKFYKEYYPEDEIGIDIKAKLNFYDVIKALNDGADIDETIGTGDSIIRERIFEEISDTLAISYNKIYRLWLDT